MADKQPSIGEVGGTKRSHDEQNTPTQEDIEKKRRKKEELRGVWRSIHVTGAWCDTPEKQIFYNGWIRVQIENLGCEDCVGHAKEYLEKNPPEDEDPFVHGWRFHNAVNERLGKPQMEYSTARDLFLGGGIKACDGGCPDKGGDLLKGAGQIKTRFRY